MNPCLPREVEANGWCLAPGLWETLAPAEQEFLMLELGGARTLDAYLARLRALGFQGLGVVLDAGCGMGQWTVALSLLNERAHGMDVSTARLAVATGLAAGMGRKNVLCSWGALESIPFPDSSFEGLFCYGVFMFADIRRAANEMRRVLKPGGRLYVNANGPGWYLHLLLDRGLRGGKPALVREALRYLLRTLMGRGSRIVVARGRLVHLLEKRGFRVTAVGADGEIFTGAGQAGPPFYPARYHGLTGVHEVLAEKIR